MNLSTSLQSRASERARPRRLVRPVLLAAPLLLALLAFAAPAGADIGETIIQRCTHGQSLGGFTQSAYSQALNELSADAEEYTDCSSLIRQAQLAAAGHRAGTGTSAGEATPVPIVPNASEQTAIAHATHAGSTPVQIGAQVIHPGVVHANISSAFSSLPTPLFATIAFLLACLLVVAGGALRNHLRARRSR